MVRDRCNYFSLWAIALYPTQPPPPPLTAQKIKMKKKNEKKP